MIFLKSIQLKNFLSYGNNSSSIPMESLNIIIGANGSGKSNLIEAISLLRSSPQNLWDIIRDGGGMHDWLWKGASGTPVAQINTVWDYPGRKEGLRYVLGFGAKGQQFAIEEERIENEKKVEGCKEPYFYYKFERSHGILNTKGVERRLMYEDIDPTQSILAQRKDPDQYPELTFLGNALSKIKIYREWSFGRYTIPRLPQKADLPNEFLEPDARNLGLVLNRLEREPAIKKKIMAALEALYPGIDNYYIQTEAGTVQIFFHEGDRTIPATRLSDGTLRYLCLLTILCHPSPPPLICIEEPELGLHPDVLPTLADLMKDASQRCQLIVTTHSDILVDALSDQPEAILVAEKSEEGTTLERLSNKEIQPWLEKYKLGELWKRGEIGGNRW